MNVHKLIFKIPFIVTVSVIIATISSIIMVSVLSSKAMDVIVRNGLESNVLSYNNRLYFSSIILTALHFPL